VRKFKLQKFSPTTKEVRNFKHFSVDDFRSDLLQVPWDMIFTLYNPNACWILWKSFFDEILNKHAQLHFAINELDLDNLAGLHHPLNN
jgi:hypothetical protein